jgi:hypothetical protein
MPTAPDRKTTHESIRYRAKKLGMHAKKDRKDRK